MSAVYGAGCACCGFRMGHASGCREGPESCALCGRPQDDLRRRDDESAVCMDCIRGYRMCEHGYMPEGVCHHCQGG